MPSGVWNGIKLIAIVDDRVFLGIGNELTEVFATSGKTKWQRLLSNTPIHKMSPLTDDNSGLIVLNSYYSHSHSQYGSNLKCVSVEGDLYWSAELPIANDVFVGFTFSDSKLTGFTWDGWNCNLDVKTGKIVDKHWTK